MSGLRRSDPLAFEPRQLDNYASLSYKGAFDGGSLGQPWITTNWIPRDARRRLLVYAMLSTFLTGNARRVLTGVDDEARLEHREYGDPKLIVSRIVAGILGDRLDVHSPKLAKAIADPPDASDKPQPPPADLEDSEVEQLIFEAALEVWKADKRAELDAWKEARETLETLRKAEAKMREWMVDEAFESKINGLESEYVVPLGEGVLEFVYSTQKSRPLMVVHAPDAYHPDLDTSDGEFPTKVHLIWELEADPDAKSDEERHAKVRRKTYELDVPEGGTERRCLLSDITFDLGLVSRANQADIGEDVTEWPVDRTLGTIAVNEAGVEADRLDLGIDFLPLVHVPHNDPTGGEHFGQSELAMLARLFDDLAALDTDLQRATALAGSPLVMVTGVNVTEDLVIGPGEVWGGGNDGKMQALDMTHSADTIAKRIDETYRRLAALSQVPEAMLGRIETQNFPSGIALRMAFAPFDQKVATSRMVRSRKYALALKIVQRLWAANGGTDLDVDLDLEIVFGEYLPTDIGETAQAIAQLLTAGGISRRTGLEILRLAGAPIDDIDEELRSIEQQDHAGAKLIADATGSEQAALDYLGIDAEPPAAAPAAPSTALLPGTVPRPQNPPVVDGQPAGDEDFSPLV